MLSPHENQPILRAGRPLAEAQAALILVHGRGATAASILELAELVAGLFPDRGLRVERVADSHPTGYLRTAIDRACPDTSRLRALGWSPHYPVREGFRRTILSYETPAAS